MKKKELKKIVKMGHSLIGEMIDTAFARAEYRLGLAIPYEKVKENWAKKHQTKTTLSEGITFTTSN